MKIRNVLAVTIALATASNAVAAAPMDLTRRDARWIEIQVVTSRHDASSPRLSRPVRAWYEVGPTKGQRTVTVPGHSVEAVLFADRSPVDHSFSDFVWIFDAQSGHVQSARFTGQLDEPIHIGPIRSRARVVILVELSTHAPGGYRSARRLAGRTVIGYCPDPDRSDCTPVPSAAYDADTGWVQANGAVCAVWRSFETRAYTPLGQARFQELDPGMAARSLPFQSHSRTRTAARASDGRAC